MRILFVVNPTAGKGRSKRLWEQSMTKLREFGDFDVAYTTERGDATRLTQAAADKGYDRVAAVGGDGTVFEVVNGLVGRKTALAVVPGGTGNDYATALGLPRTVHDAAKLALLGQERPVDIGRISNGVHFINVAGIGFDAEVVARVNAYPKYFGGTIPYLAGAIKTLWQYSPQPVEIIIDDQPIRHQKILLLAIGLGPTYGGGMQICPSAKVDDGLFELCVGGDLKLFETLRLLPTIYKGTHVLHPKVAVLRGRHIQINSQIPVAMHADGELVGHLPAEFTILPRHLKVVTPEQKSNVFS
jgi:diacylglycerol kinase (ATP)